MILLLLIVVIFSIIATNFFSEHDEIRFGKFSLSLYTMWSIGLAPAVGHEIALSLMDDIGAEFDTGAGWFFGLYSFLVHILLNNIVVMVLLREFLACTVDDERSSALAAEERRQKLDGDVALIRSPLDPLLQEMVNFNDEQELHQMISDLFHCIQPAQGEEIGFSQFQSGLRPAFIHINQEDWQRLTKGILRPGKQSLDEDAFHKMMQQQMRVFASRGLIDLMGLTSFSSSHGDQGLPPIGSSLV